ncbi:hypothetical protein CAEBREN_15214 [Caenorhabditis brenneri]|uniref:K Homology domain-containing protein n=1 Tax=Caenorhabditis brenneri TaxID=135651 RepID=G0MEA1_CAEBE|nr:hypothetical protein CAEBREN_15214 [Caenorhabditis brenneri]
MDYFNAGSGGATGNGATDPYSVIPQQFGNGGQPPPQQPVFADYQQDVTTDYETYQQQQQQQQQHQYRAAQAAQQSPSMYYQNQVTAAQGSYFPIHSASEHDFLGPQQPAAATATTGQTGAPYQGRTGANKEFMIQHQQRRGNQSGQQHSQQSQQNTQQQQQQQQNQAGRSQNQQQPQQQQMQPQTTQPSHFMQHQLQAAAVQQQQAAAQQMHRLQGAPINPQQFMVPPPAIMQQQQLQQVQQQQVQQMHQMQLQHQQQQLMQQQAQQQGYQQHQQSQHQQGHHQQNHQNHSQHHNQSHPGQHHIPHNPMMPMMPRLKDWPIRCVVEGKYQSVIIGPHGSTIKEIAQSTHCRVEFVNLSKRERTVLGNNERILTVHGNAEHASKAVSRILHVIQSEALKDDDNVGVDIVLRLRAHNQLCGRLIGKAGSSIKEIMQKTGTNITVTKYIEPLGGPIGLRQDELLCLMERTIMVRGPSIEAVVQAESLISAKLKKCYESDSQLRAQALSAPMPMMMPPVAPPGASGMAVPGPQFYPSPAGVVQVQHFPPSQHLLHSTANNSFLQPGVLQIHPGVTNLRQVRMWVPDNMIGALIGTKGKNIKMIIRETGSVVKIEAPEEKVQREAEEAEKKKQRAAENGEDERDGAASGDHPQEFLEDNGTVTSSDAIEEKPKPVSERMVTITGDDLQLLKAQSFVFTKIAETAANMPNSSAESERVHGLKLRTEVSVPTKIIGKIIGKGGQNVRELQRITGAVVKIPVEERKGGEVHRYEDGYEEDMTMIRTVGNMYSTHNVQFRLAHLVNDYYHSQEHRQNRSEHKSGRPQSAPSTGGKDGSALKMDKLGQVSPIAATSNRTTPKSSTSPKAKTP